VAADITTTLPGLVPEDTPVAAEEIMATIKKRPQHHSMYQ